MGNATDKLYDTLKATLDAIQDHTNLLSQSANIDEKQKLATIINVLCESQKNIVKSIDILYDDDFDFISDDNFEDDYYDNNDEEMTILMDTKQLRFNKEKKSKAAKNKKSIKKLEDKDLPF